LILFNSKEEITTGLARRLGAWDLTMLVVGGVIGGGIFLTPASIARQLPDAAWILGVWIAGGILTIAGGLVHSELGAMIPEAGGTYVYLREAYGGFSAFLYGWLACFVIESGSMAAVAVGLAEYLGVFFPRIGAREILTTIGPVTVSTGQLVAISAVLLLSATHYIGVREGVRIQGLFTLVILAAMAVISAGGIFAAAAGPRFSAPPIRLGVLGSVLVAVLWSYYGWNEALTAAGEVRNPQRNIPIGLLAGTGLVTLLYVGVNAAFLRVMPIAELASTARPAQLASARLFGPAATLLISGAIVAMAIGCTSASVVPGPRIAFALAKDRLFPAIFGRAHPRFRTPAFAITVQAAWTSILCLSGRYDQLYTYATFAVIVAYTATGLSLFIFRKTRPAAPRPYRCWGYPVVPVLFVASSALVAAATLHDKPGETLSGLAILALGVPVYFWMKKTRGESR
jgi:APA family basic amino acid/polyamine antiporter